jgi:hypothetical protein
MIPHLSITQVFIVWVLGFGAFSLWSKKFIAQAVNRLNLPSLFKYFLVLTPVALLEESLTIQQPYFWGIIPIMIAFYIVFFVIYLFQRYTRSSYLTSAIVAGCVGWVTEFFMNGLINQVSGLILIVMSVLCFFIYAVMALLPGYCLQYELQKKAENQSIQAN